jgi:hypothetical protein
MAHHHILIQKSVSITTQCFQASGLGTWAVRRAPIFPRSYTFGFMANVVYILPMPMALHQLQPDSVEAVNKVSRYMAESDYRSDIRRIAKRSNIDHP